MAQGFGDVSPSDKSVDSAGMSVIGKMTRMLNVLAQVGDTTAAHLAAELDEPVASVYRMLGHLDGIGWVERGGARGHYRLGIDLVSISQAIESSLDIRRLAAETLKDLHRQTHESTYLCVRHDHRAVCIERLDGRFIQAAELPLGGSLPLHRGASALAILAFEPAEFRRSYIATLIQADANPFTEADAQALAITLDQVRANGVAISDGDVTPGTLTVSAPVFSHRGDVLGSIALSGLRARVDKDDIDLVSLVRAGARGVSTELGYHGNGRADGD